MADSHRSLIAWQHAVSLVTEIYRASERFPDSERFGLTTQIRRAAVSVPSNIAEGKGRATQRDYLHFLYLARGSLLEVDTQLEIARNLGYLSPDSCADLCAAVEEAGRILNGLISSIERNTQNAKASR